LKTLLIYHRADNDGRMCRAVLAPHYARYGPVTAVGWDYGDPVPDISLFDQVVMADIAIPKILDAPEFSGEHRTRLMWIDHHLSALTPGREDIPGLRHVGMAACRLAWLHTHPAVANPTAEVLRAHEDRPFEGEPEGVFLLGLRDVWKHKGTAHEGAADCLNATCMARPAILAGLAIAKKVPDELFIAGDLLRSADAERNRENAGRAAHHVMFHGLKVLALNTPERGSRLLEKDPRAGDADAILVWCHTGDGMVTVSLYHAPGQEHRDLTEIVKLYGGGGHRGAAGFRCRLQQLLPFLDPNPQPQEP
jgi:hypothetical protein